LFLSNNFGEKLWAQQMFGDRVGGPKISWFIGKLAIDKTS